MGSHIFKTWRSGYSHHETDSLILNVYYRAEHMITSGVSLTKPKQSINGLVQNEKISHMRPNKKIEKHNVAFFYEPTLAHAITKDREYSLRSDNAHVFFKGKSNSLPYKAKAMIQRCLSRMKRRPSPTPAGSLSPAAEAT